MKITNKENKMSKPKIFCFSNIVGGGRAAYAMAEDGTVLGSHWCSPEGYITGDLGVNPGSRPDRHENDYSKHYPDGYEMEFVPSREIDNHEGLQKAFALNTQQGIEAEEKANKEKQDEPTR
jgi:hypothetical protein